MGLALPRHPAPHRRARQPVDMGHLREQKGLWAESALCCITILFSFCAILPRPLYVHMYDTVRTKKEPRVFNPNKGTPSLGLNDKRWLYTIHPSGKPCPFCFVCAFPCSFGCFRQMPLNP